MELLMLIIVINVSLKLFIFFLPDEQKYMDNQTLDANEKEIIRGNFGKKDIKKLINTFSIIMIILLVLLIILSINDNIVLHYGVYTESPIVFLVLSILSAVVIGIILLIICYFYILKMEIIVTNIRVFGKKAYGKRVDLPIDSISAIGTSSFSGIDIGTSSGKIKFKGILNNKEIHAEISKLLKNRQNKLQKQINTTSTTDELKKYKELLDSGVITQDEFETKKKQLLNL